MGVALETRKSCACNEDGILRRDNPQEFTITAPPTPLYDVTLTVALVADLNSGREEIDLSLNGWALAAITRLGECADPPTELVYEISSNDWTAAVGSQDAVLTLTPSQDVNPFECDPPSWATLDVEYLTSSPEHDSNGNGIVDACELELFGDFDGDGDIDLSDLAFLLGDYDCPGPACAADLDGDGDTDLADLAILLAHYE